MKTGKANYEKGGFKKKNYFKQEDGDVVYRILPPLGDLADKGVWSRYYAVHFGYKNLEGKIRPFVSPLQKNNKTKMIEVPDAAVERLDDLKAKLEKARSEGNGPLMAKLNTLVGLKGVYSLDKGFHMNVVDLQGNIGVLKIRYRAKQLLDQEIEKLRDEGVDPLSLDNGRFFVFNRNNKGLDTSFKVSVYTEKLDVPGVGKVDRQVVHKLTPEILSRLESEASDLDSIFNKVTSEEVAEIVATSDLMSGKSSACNKYFDERWKARKEAAKAAEEDDSNQYEPDDTVPAPVAAQTTTLAPVTSSANASVTAVPAQLVVAQPVQTKTQAAAIEELSDAEFFEQIKKDQSA